MSELYCIKLRASVYFFILISHVIPDSIWEGMCTAHYLKERKGGRKEDTEEEKVKGKEGHREGEEGWKKKGN